MPAGINSDDIAIPHSSLLPSTQIVPSKRSSSTAPENDLPSKRSRTESYVLDTSSDFASLAEDGAFVDKSLALHDFLEDHTPIHLLLRPRRSGKTIFLKMFRNFFESTTPDEQARRKAVFEPLAIAGYPTFDEFGKYPVLHIDFSNVIGSTMADLLSHLKMEIRDVVLLLNDAGFFDNRGKLDASWQEFLEAMIGGTLPDSELYTALFKLTAVTQIAA